MKKRLEKRRIEEENKAILERLMATRSVVPDQRRLKEFKKEELRLKNIT
jgi:hypothetical protein